MQKEKDIETTKNISSNEEISMDKDNNAFDTIKEYRMKNVNKVILANLNINSIPNKFSSLKELVSNNIDVLVIQETKLDETLKNLYNSRV